MIAEFEQKIAEAVPFTADLVKAFDDVFEFLAGFRLPKPLFLLNYINVHEVSLQGGSPSLPLPLALPLP